MKYFSSKTEDQIEPQVTAAVNNADTNSISANTDPADTARELLALYHSIGKINFDLTKEIALDCVEDILEHWLPDGEQKGREYKPLNPTRDDGSPDSFSINMESGLWADFATDDRGGDLISLISYLEDGISQSEAAIKILEFIAGMKTDDGAPVVKRSPKPKAAPTLTYTAVMPIPAEAMSRRPIFFGAELGTPAKTWEYLNAAGQVMCYVHRFDLVTGKSFRPQTFCKDSTGWESWKTMAPPVPRPAYGLDRLAARPEAPVLFTEGEKAADAAQRLFPEYVAVTTMNGSQSPEKTDLTPFAGRKVFIAPDNDEAGTGYKDKLIELLGSASAEVIAVMQLSALVRNDVALSPGYDLADAEADGWSAEALAALGDGLWEPVQEAFIEVKDYYIYKDSVYRHWIKDDVPYRKFVCSHLLVKAQSREVNGTKWGKYVEFDDPDGAPHSWSIPVDLLVAPGAPFVKTLASLGLRVEVGAKGGDEVARYINAVQPTERFICTSKPGWYGNVFATYNGMVGSSEEKVVIQGASPVMSDAFSQQGSLNDWQTNVAKSCEGNSRLIFALSTAFASPALYWLNVENGGFHLMGPSSIGKTVAMSVGVSVWGSPNFMQCWRATTNGLEGTATKYNDTFLALDELSQIDSAEAGAAAYMLGNGHGKIRSETSGLAKDVPTWRLIFLSTGEISLEAAAIAAGGRVMAGQEIRMVNIPADAGVGLGIFEDIHNAQTSAIFADTLKQTAGTIYGTAGLAWVEALTDTDKRNVALNTIRAVTESFVTTNVDSKSAGQVSRVAARFGLVARVGEACIELGILPFESGAAIDAATKCYLAWVDQRGGVKSHESTASMEQVRHFIATNAESRFTVWHEDGLSDNDIKANDFGPRTINRAGFRKQMPDGTTNFYVFSDVFRQDICRGFRSAEVAKTLVENGFLIPGNDGKPSSIHRLPSNPKLATRCYVITSAILTGEPVLPVTLAA